MEILRNKTPIILLFFPRTNYIQYKYDSNGEFLQSQKPTFTLALLFIVLCFIGCKEIPIAPVNNNSFAIYFLKDTTLTIKDILDIKLGDLKLADNPWITQDEIKFYDWSSHCIYLKKDKSNFFPNYHEGFYQIPLSWTDRPWIVVANKIPCYQGFIVTDASINIFPFPEISGLEAGTWEYPKDILTSEWIFWFLHSDPRDNELVKESLIQNGLFHGGIKVTFDTSNTPIKVFNDDTTTVEYSLIIKNNDTDNLYIFDPYKVENKVFHYHNMGPNFLEVNTGKSYGSNYMEIRKPDSWDSNWYFLLKSGGSIKRTIELRGYPFIPAGTYLIQGGYSCPQVEKNIRETQQGRYFVGRIRTDTLRIKIIN